MKFLKLITLGIVVGVVVGLVANATISLKSDYHAVQDVRSLDSRINMLEQRFYSIQTSVNRLEQLAITQRSTGPRETVLDQQLNMLTQEVQKLIIRLDDAECGLIKLDERTAAGMRRSGRTANDPCRLNPTAPLQLPARP